MAKLDTSLFRGQTATVNIFQAVLSFLSNEDYKFLMRQQVMRDMASKRCRVSRTWEPFKNEVG